MRRTLALSALTALTLVSATRAPAAINDPAYHTNAEVNERIFFLEDSLRNAGFNWLRVDSIGYSQAEMQPIYCVKLAAPDVDDTTTAKPSVVLIGQVHAEEVLGVEYCLWLIDYWLSRSGVNWRTRVDLYIIPTANPEGLDAVYTIDNTYRKNKRDNIGDGRFRYQVGWGQDTSGVDINRNFPLFWYKGSPFLKRGDNEFYDYYRGPGPFSEPETQAIDKLFDRVRPLYSIILHSSRTGKVAEQVIYPWGFAKETKLAPDIRALDQYAIDVANRCRKYGQPIPYEAFRIANTQGDAETYFYWRYGTFSSRVEIGAEGEAMQPDSAGIFSVINSVHYGLEYMINSAANVASDPYGPINKARLNIKVVDAATDAPLEARLALEGISNQMIPFRKTNPRTGRFYWPVLEGFNSNLTISRYGYQPMTVRVTPNERVRTYSLQPLPLRRVGIALDDGSLPLTSPATLNVLHTDSTFDVGITSGSGVTILPDGSYTLTLYSGSEYVPRRASVTISSDTTLNISLSPATVLLFEDFDGGDITYSSDNTMNEIPNHAGLDSLARWDLIDDVFHSFPKSLTDSRLTDTYRRENAWVAPYNLHDFSFDLSTSRTAALVYWLNQALEPACDSLYLEVSSGGAGDPSTWTWTQAAPAHQELSVIYSIPERPWNATPVRIQKYGAWKQFIVPLDQFCGGSVFHFRFHLRTDTTIEEDGVYIDDVTLLASGQAPPAISAAPTLPFRFTLGAAYPNPFNGRTSFEIALPVSGRTRVALYDLTGRKALEVADATLTEGRHRLSLDASSLPNGLYILRAVSPTGEMASRKLTLMK